MRFAPKASTRTEEVSVAIPSLSDTSFEPFSVTQKSNQQVEVQNETIPLSADSNPPVEEAVPWTRPLAPVISRPVATQEAIRDQKIVLKRVACFNHVPIILGQVGDISSARIFDTPALADPMRVKNPFNENRSSDFSGFIKMIGQSAISPKPMDDHTHRARVYQYLRVSRQMEEAKRVQTVQEELPVLEIAQEKEMILEKTKEVICDQATAPIPEEIFEELPNLNFSKPQMEEALAKPEKVEAIYDPKLQLISSQNDLAENLNRLYKIADASEFLPLLQVTSEICQRIKIIFTETNLFSSNVSETERRTMASFQGADWSISSKFNRACIHEVDYLIMTIDQILKQQDFTATALHLVRKKIKIVQNLFSASSSSDFSMMRYLLHIREHGTEKVECADWRTTHKISTVSNLSFYSLKKDELKLKLTSKKSLAFLLFAHARMNFELRKIMNALLAQEIHRCRIVSKTAITFESLNIEEKQKKNLFFRLLPSAAYLLPWATDLASQLFLKVATGKKISEEKIDFALARLQRLQLA